MESAITETPVPSVLDRVMRAATIEEIEAEQELLRATIEEVKATAALTIQQKRNSIDALEVIRRALILQRDGKPPAKEKPEGEAKPKKRRRGPGGSETLADRIETLLRQRGPLKITEMEGPLGKPYATIYSALNCDRFEIDPSTKRYSVVGQFE